jgi:superfamily II DNA or RNA helicase
MSTKFFTNAQENTLLNKIEGIFKHRNVHFFDALVGYFRASGYFRIRPFVEKAAEIRILVGINIDNLVYEANKRGLLFIEDPAKSRDDFFEEIRKNIQEAEYDKEVEDGMFGLITDLATGRIRIKVHPKQNLHAKIYIFREKDKHSHGYGSVITGSSNLTDNGLERNFEFNVELRDNSDIDFATETFDKLWQESIEVGKEFVDKLKKETYLNDEFTPFEVYMKFLIEYFGRSIDFDPNSIQDLPQGFKKLSYQVDAVADGYNKMMKHNGFFLSDVVGLGKTIVATLIAKKFFYTNGFPSYLSKTLIICPPAIKENWEDTLSKFGMHNCKIETSGSLHKITKPSDYDLIIVDEAHKFRSDSAEMYFHLQNICKSSTRKKLADSTYEHKRVMLISATPLNNKPEDIANLVYLFQDAKNSTLEGVNGSLQHFFRGQIDAYKKLKSETDIQQVSAGVKTIYEKIRAKVIEPLTVRRTRTDLNDNKEYKKDLIAQGINFPNTNKPEKIFYKLDKHLENLYDQTLTYLKGGVDGLTYNRYQAIKFLKPHKKEKYNNADRVSTQLAFIMKTLLVKRIDSSFYAFKQSLRRFFAATDAMVKMFENNVVYIAPKYNVSDYINEGREEELILLLTEMMETDPSIEICSADDFEVGFITGLKKDRTLLNELVSGWEKINQDPKLDEFIFYLKNKLFDEAINKEQKLVVFSESKETTSYLLTELQKSGLDKILVVDSKNRKDKFPLVKANFDANIEDQKNDYNIVISTEVLAEGVNMHRANIIVNYDTPWNSTKLMQRIGRINRIGSKAKEIHIFNFFPTAQVNSDIELEKKAIMKLQAFHSAMGEDSQIYSPDEEIESFGLFDKNLDEERDEKLKKLMWLRDYKKNNPDSFKRIKNMPMKARVGRKSPVLKGSTITFIRNEKRDVFLLIKENNDIEELTFLQAEKEYFAKDTEKQIPLHGKHHEQVLSATSLFANKIEEEKSRDRKVDIKEGPNERKAKEYLTAFLNSKVANSEEVILIKNAVGALRVGKFQQLQRDINKYAKNAKDLSLATKLEGLIKLLNKYPLQEVNDTTEQLAAILNIKEFKPEIIISESFNN